MRRREREADNRLRALRARLENPADLRMKSKDPSAALPLPFKTVRPHCMHGRKGLDFGAFVGGKRLVNMDRKLPLCDRNAPLRNINAPLCKRNASLCAGGGGVLRRHSVIHCSNSQPRRTLEHVQQNGHACLKITSSHRVSVESEVRDATRCPPPLPSEEGTVFKVSRTVS